MTFSPTLDGTGVEVTSQGGFLVLLSTSEGYVNRKITDSDSFSCTTCL